MLKLKDLMNRDVVAVSPDLTLRELLEVLAEREVSGAPVVSGGKVVGVISTTDIFDFQEENAGLSSRPASGPDDTDAPGRKRGGTPEGWDPSEEAVEWTRATRSRDLDVLDECTVADVMTRDVLSQPSSTSLERAARYMLDSGIRRILVIDKGKLQGIVTTTDIVRAVAEGMLKS
ncbi:MAG: CBS domain-containing protein [Gemmatimonadota bacterium]|nr:MAG: CBS domain-containing protein [Gemmatimonadota bacterium]